MSTTLKRAAKNWWPVLAILLGSSWLYAPYLNKTLIGTTTLISEYESIGQPYSWLFRLCDVLSAAIIGGIVVYLLKHGRIERKLGILLGVYSVGAMFDGVLTFTCVRINNTCSENLSLGIMLHALETSITATALFLAIYRHYRLTKNRLSLLFLWFQILYGILLVSTLLLHVSGHRTISQFAYQIIVLLWVIGVLRRYLGAWNGIRHTRRLIAVLVMLNGIGAVVVSVFDLPGFHFLNSLYLANGTAWLAQHTILTGLLLLYLSRHIDRGETNARLLTLFILGGETLKYSVLSPNPLLMTVYALSFVAVYLSREQFDRKSVALRPRRRFMEGLQAAGIMLGVFAVTFGIAAFFDRLGKLPTRFDNYMDVAFRIRPERPEILQGALAAHLINAAIAGVLALLLYSLFRPRRHVGQASESERADAAKLLREHSTSSEDFFKLWPHDKSYLWNERRTGFIAYKVVGSTAFALAEPIAPPQGRAALRRDFKAHCRAHGWRATFLMVNEKTISKYEAADYPTYQIGSSAVINIGSFVNETSRDKWWRWQSNRADKAGLQHHVSEPPHTGVLLQQCQAVSQAWLDRPGRREQGFAMGYFNEEYLKKCRLHYLSYDDGRVVAFTNELPIFKGKRTSVDLIRFLPDTDGAMPALLLHVLKFWHEEAKFREFDLGFVPLAGQDSVLAGLAKVFGGRRFAAEGLEQFKNKFDPVWEQNYIAIDGDLADLAATALNLERAMSV